MGVAGRPADGLDQRALVAQEALLVGIEDRHQGDLRNIQALPQQVDAHQHIELAQAQVADDLHPLHGIDVRVQVAYPHVMLVQVLGKVLGHALGQGGHQHPLFYGGAQADLREQVVHLGGGRADLQLRVEQAGGAHHLLHHLAGVLRLVGTRRRRDEDGLGADRLPLLELHGAVVQRRGEPEAVLHQGLLAGAVALVHAPHLGNADVALVDEEQGVVGQVVEEGGRRLAGVAPGEVAGVVLDAVAVAQLQHHLDVVEGALLQALGLHQAVMLAQPLEALDQLRLDGIDGAEDGLPGRDVVGLGVDRHPRHLAPHLAGQGVEEADGVDLVIEELDAHRLLVGVRRVDIDDVAAHPVGAAPEVHVVAGVLQLRQAAQEPALVDQLAAGEVQAHLQVLVGVPQAVDRRHRHHDQRIAALQQRLGGGEAHLLDVVVDGGILLDEGVRRRHIGLGLVVVVVGDEVLDGVVGKERLEFTVELRRQGLVGRHDDGRALQALDHVGHGEGLAGAGDPEQGLVGQPRLEPAHQAVDGRGLVAGGLELRGEAKGSAHGVSVG